MIMIVPLASHKNVICFMGLQIELSLPVLFWARFRLLFILGAKWWTHA